MAIQVKREMIVPASGKPINESRRQHYIDLGLTRRETRSIESQSDTSDYTEYRDSPDNGRTWGPWIRTKAATKEHIGDDDIAEGNYTSGTHIWNPVHRHFISLRFMQIYVGGYEAATNDYWSGGRGESAHTYLDIVDCEGNALSSNLVMYEDGPQFDKQTYRESGFLNRNFGIGTFVSVMKCGDILFDLWIPVSTCCAIMGLDIRNVYPSAPEQPNALLICRGKWNEESLCYDLSFTPVMLDDRQSSRGISEPVIAELESGKILVVFRASNLILPRWNPRISPYAPGYKFYCLSDDGGKTFSPPMPWHFDSREVVYSPATYAIMFRSETNKKLYWVGNITDPTKTSSNYPRWPLQIVEVDEEWGVAKKDSLTVIDTRREGETELVQLSNFGLLQDRETGNVEIYLTKYGQYPDRDTRDCEVWKYTITLPK